MKIKMKSVPTFVLLSFVAASVAAMVWKDVKHRPDSPQVVKADTNSAKLIAYYFHGKVRCVTCNDIEQSTRQVIEADFQPELASGRLEYRVINYDEPGNTHYATDYQLAAPCVVLSSWRDGRQESWESLPEVWELVGDRPAFKQFIRHRLAERLASRSPERSSEAEDSKPAATSNQVLDEGMVVGTHVPMIPRLMDLGSGHCVPCKKMAPILDELREEYEGRFDVVFVDVGKDPDAADTYGISVIPTQIFFDAECRERFRHECFLSREEILATWERLGIDVGHGSGSE